MSRQDPSAGGHRAGEIVRALQAASRRAARGWRRGCALLEPLEPRVLLSRVLFGGAALYDTGTGPQAVVAADFNGDGKKDLAVANAGDNTVSILLNNGDGTYAAKVDYPTGASPYALTAADFNGDGKIDLAVVDEAANSVSVLLNQGNGTFAGNVDYPVGGYPYALTAADFNGDGKMDLAVANGRDNTVSILLNNEDGTFATKVDYTTGVNPDAVASGDFNEDGRADLAVANFGDNTVSVLLNNNDSAGTFAAKMDYATGANPIAVIAADLNRDGRADLAVANNGDGTVSVLLNNDTSDGTFAGKADYTAGSNPSAVAVADFNGDGLADLAVANADGGSVSVLLNNGDGTFAGNVDYMVGATPVSVIAADLNGDGMADLAVADRDANVIGVLRNKGDGTFATKTDYATGSNPVAVVAADFNGDGLADLAVANNYNGTVSVLLNNGDGTFASNVDYPTGSAPTAVVAADFNGDGMPDLAVTNADDNTLSILLNTGDGTFAAGVSYAAGTDPVSVIAADFNGDGKPDLAVANADDNTVSVLLNNSDGTFAAKVDYPTGLDPQAVTAADFNGDGMPDLAVANASGNTVSVLLNAGGGAFAAKVDYPAGAAPMSVCAADFNGDGKADLAVANQGDNTVSVLLNNRRGMFAAKVDYAVGMAPVSVIAQDFNGDGKADLAVANFGSSSVTVLQNNGQGLFTRSAEYLTGPSASAVAAGNFNGDGKPGLAVADYYGGSVSVLRNDLQVPTQLEWAQPPVNSGAKQIPTPLVVYVEDDQGHVIGSDDSKVTLSIASGPGALRGTVTLAAVDGVATFSNLSFTRNGTYTLRASCGGGLTSISNAFTIGARLVFQGLPATAIAGTAIGPSFNVLIEDARGHILKNDDSTVTLALAGDPDGLLLNGTLAVPAVNGVAHFSGLSIEIANKYRLLAADGAITGAISHTFRVVPAAPVQSQLVFAQDASDCAAGVKMKPAMRLEFRDQYGNLASNYRGTVTLSIAQNSSGGTLSGTTRTTVKNGYATFCNVILRTAGSYSLNAAIVVNGAAGGLQLTSSPFTVAPNTAKKLAFAQVPTSAIAGTEITPAITVDVTDAYGNVITNSTTRVTLAIRSGPKGGTFTSASSGTFTSLTATAVNGVAAFRGIALSKSGTYKLKAMATGLSTTVSSGIAITPEPVTSDIYTIT